MMGTRSPSNVSTVIVLDAECVGNCVGKQQDCCGIAAMGMCKVATVRHAMMEMMLPPMGVLSVE